MYLVPYALDYFFLVIAQTEAEQKNVGKKKKCKVCGKVYMSPSVFSWSLINSEL